MFSRRAPGFGPVDSAGHAEFATVDMGGTEAPRCRGGGACAVALPAGYYVSLLAAARDHHAIPDIITIQCFKSQTIVRTIAEDVDA